MPRPTSEITSLLDAWGAGSAKALDELIPVVVEDLRRMARGYLAKERPGHTLEPTALVNEVYLRLVGRRTVQWASRIQFFATMAQIMRRILVDHARRRSSGRHGGGATRVSFDEGKAGVMSQGKAVELVDLDDALRRLASLDERQGRVVELRFFGGLTIDEAAETLGIAPRTVKRDWRVAKLWLLRELSRRKKMA